MDLTLEMNCALASKCFPEMIHTDGWGQLWSIDLRCFLLVYNHTDLLAYCGTYSLAQSYDARLSRMQSDFCPGWHRQAILPESECRNRSQVEMAMGWNCHVNSPLSFPAFPVDHLSSPADAIPLNYSLDLIRCVSDRRRLRSPRNGIQMVDTSGSEPHIRRQNRTLLGSQLWPLIF